MRRLLLVLLLAAGAACSSAGAAEADRTITIEIEHSAFHPTKLDVLAGERIRFVVVNNDPIDHEFIIGDEEMQLIHEEGTESHHGARDGEISIPAGETRETSFTFDEPGSLIYGCHIPLHYRYGMRGEIRID